ncbi:response regulator [Trinickia caryophylli]|uniref:Two-component system, OmpR family, response regulator BaeR n=1 Tax=Trinickia caryophylli TaxID=28094 RepID=A0A1X7D735_TRICW|nr:response regulator [Trinickia caryophylli]PMS12657.1 two-component system response regulator BaeR [Trinickia caryophylli]TRX15063.1 response regulator [Trinickia caryophylli]WQE14921.1 response regulator [Trinickia caryophylli]SMF10087.1 two-component system, OmpR family, response regulator BaeR [Trinickia caryophylli]GLU31351.1 DNA-binding response regulator [Trinickia caryophylli]
MTDRISRPGILIVEDEPKLSALLADYLRAEGYDATVIADGLDAIAHVHAHAPALILLDLMLPGRGGLEICRELRTFSDTPVIIITARVDEIDRLLGLELGADDYVCKPFSPREVVARVKAILRRVENAVRAAQPDNPAPSPFHIDLERHIAELDSRDLNLTPIELRLLSLLHSTPGRIYPRDLLLRSLYDDHRVVADRTVDTHIKNLRRKLQAVRPQQDMIRSIYGVGYRLERYPDQAESDS